MPRRHEAKMTQAMSFDTGMLQLKRLCRWTAIGANPAQMPGKIRMPLSRCRLYGPASQTFNSRAFTNSARRVSSVRERTHQPFADALPVATQARALALPATRLELGVQRGQALDRCSAQIPPVPQRCGK